MNAIMFKDATDKVLKSNNLFFTFVRSTVSSQISSWTDMFTSFALFAWVNLMPWVATVIGSVVGGIVNCIIGYKFTFHAQGVSKKAVVVKFLMVWLGSVVFNSWGTDALYHLLKSWHWLETIGFRPDGFFAAARLTVSLVVSLAWNFLLQRKFVYRPVPFDKYAVRLVDALTFRRR